MQLVQQTTHDKAKTSVTERPHNGRAIQHW